MATTFRLKRSAVAGKIPAPADLALGELALNTHDGRLFTKRDDGTEAIVEIGGGSAAAVGDVLVSARNPGSGWLPCSGLTYAQAAYPALHAVLGTIEDGSTHDASSWATRSAGFGSNAAQRFFHLNGSYFALSAADSQYATSPDTISWTLRNIGFGTAGAVKAIAHGNGTYVAVGGSDYYNESYATAYIATSPDGISWTQVSGHPFTAGGLREVVFFNGRFVACGWKRQVGYSSDGVSWTKVTPPGGFDEPLWTLVTNGTVLVMFTHFDQGRYSTNGTSWTFKAFGAGQMNAAAYGNGTFVAVGQAGRIYTSADGITWTLRSGITTVDLTAITFANGLFVAAGGRDILTSTNGISWTTYSGAYGSLGYPRHLGTDGTRYLLAGSSGSPSTYTGQWLRVSTAFTYDPGTEFLVPAVSTPKGLTAHIRATE